MRGTDERLKVKKFLVLFTAFVMALIPVSANAHELYVYQGKDYARVGSGHGTIWVNDLECDSHSVYAEVYWPAEGIGGRFYDHGGCDSASERYSLPSGAQVIKLCEYYDETGVRYCTKNYDI
jgi:hypothetical protein